MEIKKIITFSCPIIQCQRSTYNWAVRLIGRQGAKAGSILKEKRDVFYILNEYIVLNSMGVIKVKRIIKMIGIGYGNSDNKEEYKNKGFPHR
jgi:hypothetical protein